MDLAVQKEKVYTSVRGRRWSKQPSSPELANHIKKKLNINYIIAEILAAKNIDTSEIDGYLEPKLKDLLPDVNSFIDMDKAVRVITQAIQTNQKIAIFGDYDVDGATSSALIKKFLLSINYDAKIYIPDRILEGYGPNFKALKQLRDEGVDVVITVDCGSSANHVIAEAKKLGLKIIVLDHHLCSENLPDADAIVNPNRLDDTSGYGYLAAVGVSFLFLVALYKELSKAGILNSKPDLLSLLDLVALGTVCDVVPLVGLNRAFVKQGIKVIESKSNTGIKALLDISKLKDDISTYHLGFCLGPRINAGGRVGSSSLGPQLLSGDEYGRCFELASQLDLYNSERRAIELAVLENALEQANVTEKKCPIIYVEGNGWHQGVIGIVAGRIKEKFHKPVAVVTFSEDKMGKASCRSITGIDFGGTVVKAKESGIISEGGGHAMAAGFSVTKENSTRLKEFFISAFQEDYETVSKNAISHHNGHISVETINLEFINSVNKLGPFGSNNAQPKFILSNILIVNPQILKGEHISCLITEVGKCTSSKVLKAIAFGAISSPIGEVLLAKKCTNLIVTLNINKWQDNIRPEVVIHDIISEN